jgi:biotin transport system substrate-specific component
LLGLVGAPVFSGFCGGYHHLIGPAGGFIIAFPILVLFCALSQKLKPVIFKILLGICGMALMYLLGIVYFSLVTKTPLWSAVLMYVLLFLKDILSLILAFYFSRMIRKRLNKKSAR